MDAPSDAIVPVVKTSISLPKVLMDFAKSQKKSEGYNSLSDLLADLLRKHKNERELIAMKLRELNSNAAQEAERLSEHAETLVGEAARPKRKDRKQPPGTS